MSECESEFGLTAIRVSADRSFRWTGNGLIVALIQIKSAKIQAI